MPRRYSRTTKLPNIDHVHDLSPWIGQFAKRLWKIHCWVALQLEPFEQCASLPWLLPSVVPSEWERRVCPQGNGPEGLHLTIKPCASETIFRTKSCDPASLSFWRMVGSVSTSEVLMNWNVYFKDNLKFGLQWNMNLCSFHLRTALCCNCLNLCASLDLSIQRLNNIYDYQASLSITKSDFLPHLIVSRDRFLKAFSDNRVWCKTILKTNPGSHVSLTPLVEVDRSGDRVWFHLENQAENEILIV